MNSSYSFLRYIEKVRGMGSGHLRSEVRADTSFWDGMEGTEPLSTWWCSSWRVDLRPSSCGPSSDANTQSHASLLSLCTTLSPVLQIPLLLWQFPRVPEKDFQGIHWRFLSSVHVLAKKVFVVTAGYTSFHLVSRGFQDCPLQGQSELGFSGIFLTCSILLPWEPLLRRVPQILSSFIFLFIE